METEKKADNIIFNEKTKINEIDLKVDSKKKMLDSLDEIEANFYSLKKNIDDCLDLFRQSIKGGNIQRKLDAISEDNMQYYNTSMRDVDYKRDEINNELKELYNEKDRINDKIRKEYRKDMDSKMEKKESRKDEI